MTPPRSNSLQAVESSKCSLLVFLILNRDSALPPCSALYFAKKRASKACRPDQAVRRSSGIEHGRICSSLSLSFSGQAVAAPAGLIRPTFLLRSTTFNSFRVLGRHGAKKGPILSTIRPNRPNRVTERKDLADYFSNNCFLC